MSINDPQDEIQVDASCLEFLDDFVAGSQEAVAIVYERYFPQLLRHAHRNIPEHLREQILASNIVQSVMCSLLAMNTERRQVWKDRYCLKEWGQVYGLLAMIVVRKCYDRARGAQRQKCDLSREVPIDPIAIITRGPDPADEVAFADLEQRMWERLGQDGQAVLAKKMEGHSIKAIAEELNMAPKMVRETLNKLNRWLQREIDGTAK